VRSSRTPSSSCISSRAPSSTRRRRGSGWSRACRASRGPSTPSPASPTTPARHRCGCAATRATSLPRSISSRAKPPGRWVATRWRRSVRSACGPT